MTKTIIPECEFIQSVLNEQIFEPLGLYFEFLPNTLDAMQEDEASRAAALGQLTGAGVPLLMVMDLLGYELTDEQRSELETAELERQARAEKLDEQMAQKPETPETEEANEPEESQDDESKTFKMELDKWKRKALNSMKRGKPANVDFVSTVIPEQVYETIASALGSAKTEEEVRAAFAVTQTEKPVYTDSIMALAAELRRANDLLEKEGRNEK